MNARWLSLLLPLVGLVACHNDKVPLRPHGGDFETLSAHYFENEKTAYVFFSVENLRPRQALASWPSAFEMAVDRGDFASLDPDKAVHRHHLVECGPGRLCGSYSFHAEQAPGSIRLRFRYSEKAALGLESTVATLVHPAGRGADSQSQFVYGVFNASNEKIQVRVHDNFGDPDDAHVGEYGLERSYDVSAPSPADFSVADEQDAISEAGTDFIYPAGPCARFVRAEANGPSLAFSGKDAWLSSSFPSEATESGACFRARLLDHAGRAVTAGMALARKNPVLANTGLNVRPPLKDAFRIPLVLSYCLDQPDAAALTSGAFLDYQRFILDIADPTIDACFALGREEQFANDLAGAMDRKLAAARAANPAGADFIFVVAINHKLSPVVRTFHETIATALAQRIARELALSSPRLVGAFVYDSQSADLRKIPQAPGITWCPRDERKGSADAANCSPLVGGEVSFGPLNFIIPMGPFPTLSSYVNYVAKYGDEGKSHDPKLNLQSVQTNGSSVTHGLTGDQDRSAGGIVTFFDGERLSLGAGEGVKFCRNRDNEHLLDQFAFRENGTGRDAKILSAKEAQAFVQDRDRGTALDVGLRWNSAYVGSFSYELPVRGHVFGFIPLSTTVRSSMPFGDPRWSRKRWNLGSLLQRCVRFCHHPTFDEGGTYQVTQSWSSLTACPNPRPPEPAP